MPRSLTKLFQLEVRGMNLYVPYQLATGYGLPRGRLTSPIFLGKVAPMGQGQLCRGGYSSKPVAANLCRSHGLDRPAGERGSGQHTQH